jgi:hypothetical protein
MEQVSPRHIHHMKRKLPPGQYKQRTSMYLGAAP